jgi:hypothetical protein
MSLGCVFGRHRPSLVSITRRRARLDALCDSCGLPLCKDERGRWVPAPPLARQREPDHEAHDQQPATGSASVS